MRRYPKDAAHIHNPLSLLRSVRCRDIAQRTVPHLFLSPWEPAGQRASALLTPSADFLLFVVLVCYISILAALVCFSISHVPLMLTAQPLHLLVA